MPSSTINFPSQAAKSRAGRTRSAVAAEPPTSAKKKRNTDPVRLFLSKPGKISCGFMINLLILMAFGLLVLFSASYADGFSRFNDSYHEVAEQFKYVVGGLAALIVASFVDYRWIRRFTWPLYIATLVLLVVVLFMEPINNHRRWINIDGIPNIQVSEIAKFSLILCLAHLFDRHHSDVKKFGVGVVLPVILLAPVLGLLSQETHYSAMVLMCGIAACMMLCGGTRLRWFVLALTVGGGGGWLYLSTRTDHVQNRMVSWLQPFSDLTGATMQTGQSLYTVASGGVLGVGIGNSVQKYWLPEAQNDFIFAILCEELGFVGALVCIVLFALFIAQGIIIANRAPDCFGFLLTIGTIAQIGLQFVANVAVVTNLFPNTGISLPFFSAGGTSLLMLMGQMGILFSVNRAGNKKLAQDRLEKAQLAEQARKQEIEQRRQSGDNYAQFEY